MNLRTTGLAIACVLVALVAAPDTGRSTTPAQAATEPPHVPFAIRTAEIAAAVALRDIPLPDPPRSRPPTATSRPHAALASGHPVQVWVEYQWVRPATGVWKAWDNTKVHYSLHEHTVVLSGLSSTQVRVNDPWPGTQYWISKSTFERSWADFFNMAIIY